MVLKFDRETERVSLGLKQIQPDPWDDVEDEVSRSGARSTARSSASPTTAPSSSSSRASRASSTSPRCRWTKRVKHPSKLVNVGDEVEAMVLEVDAKAKRISLGMKQIEPNPWDAARGAVSRSVA